MAVPSALTQVSQIGAEVNKGVAVAAATRLRSVSINPRVQVENRMHRPTGFKFPTLAIPGRDWTSFETPGVPTYDELAYIFSSVIGKGVVTQPDAVNHPTVRDWVFDAFTTAENDRQTYTVEHGSSARARRAAYMMWRSANLNITRDEVNLGGTAMGQAMAEGVALTANPGSLPDVPVVGSDFTFYSDATDAALGNTALDFPFRGVWNLEDVVGSVWPIKAAHDSYAEHVETVPGARFDLTPAADAVGSQILSDLRAGTTRFVRLEAEGPVISGAFRHRLRIDMALDVQSPGEFGEEEGVFVLPYTFHMTHDATWNRALRVELRNTRAAL